MHLFQWALLNYSKYDQDAYPYCANNQFQVTDFGTAAKPITIQRHVSQETHILKIKAMQFNVKSLAAGRADIEDCQQLSIILQKMAEL